MKTTTLQTAFAQFKSKTIHLKNQSHSTAERFREQYHTAINAATFAFAGIPITAYAQSAGSSSPFSGAVSFFCSFLGPFFGPNSKILSIILIIVMAAAAFLWWMNENKEGVVLTIARTAIALGLLINMFTVPTWLGLANPCGA